jgi:hypothetical protein
MVDPGEASGAPGAGPRIAAPSPLRLSGFLGTALGALLLGIGSILVWVTVHDVRDANGVLDRIYKGLDLTEGKVALVVAFVLLVGLMALRGARSRGSERTIATAMIVAAIVGTAFAGSALFSSFSGLAGAPQDQIHRGIGVIVATAGGVVAFLGTVLDLAWAVAPDAPTADGDAAEETLGSE